MKLFLALELSSKEVCSISLYSGRPGLGTPARTIMLALLVLFCDDTAKIAKIGTILRTIMTASRRLSHNRLATRSDPMHSVERVNNSDENAK